MSQHVAGSRLTSNIKITLKITFISEIFADITRSLAIVLLHLKFCKKILILIFFFDLFSVECKFFCPNSADNTMENRAISLVESSRDNSLIACRTSSERPIALQFPAIFGFTFWTRVLAPDIYMELIGYLYDSFLSENIESGLTLFKIFIQHCATFDDYAL